jgi:O-antigen/teichoic acid export membrane protein
MDMLDEVKEILIKAINFMLILCIPMALGFVLLSKSVLLIFSGSDFLEADITAKIMSFRVLLVPINTLMVSHLFIPLKKERCNLVSTGAAAILCFALNMLLIPLLAANGAAIATVSAELIEFTLCLFFLSKIINLRRLFNRMWQYLISAILVIPVAYYAINALVDNIYVMTSSVIALSAFFYFAFLIILKNEYMLEMLEYVKKTLKARTE